MTSNIPLDTLTDLARRRTEDAARKLASLRDADMSARDKMELLLQYRRDYGEQLHALLAAGLEAAQWRNFQDFLQALDRGIEEQRRAVEQSQVRLDHGRTDWQQQHRRQNAFETLAERLQRQQMLQQDRRDQRACDEDAARIMGRRVAQA